MLFLGLGILSLGFPWWLSSKESACNAGASGDTGSIPGSGRSPGEGNGNPLQYSCLESSMDRGAWWVTVQRGHKELDMTECLSTAQRSLRLSHSLPPLLGPYHHLLSSPISSHNLVFHNSEPDGDPRLIIWRSSSMMPPSRAQQACPAHAIQPHLQPIPTQPKSVSE